MIQIYVMIIFFVALCLIVPFVFYQLWAFIAPGLHQNERLFIYRYSIWCAGLFILGVLFAFYIGFPLVINFSLNLSEMLHIRLLFVFGILFQLPTLFMGLARFDLIDVHQLGKYRKYIYFGCFVAASIIAPPDITLNLLLTLPIILLFEFSMFIAKITHSN